MNTTSVRLVGLGVFIGASAIAGFLAGPSARRAAPDTPAVETAPSPPAPVTTATGFAPAPVAPSPPPPPLDEPIPGGLMPPVERPTAVDVFYRPLTPYGEWILIEGFGRCWRPKVSVKVAGWHPYAHGRWIATDIGWQWDSSEEWGDARPTTYHYGRWTVVPQHGWVWSPGIVWAPSWVKWRSCDGWIGWAPQPAVYRWGDRPAGETEPAADVYIFVPSIHFLDPHPVHWRVSGPEHRTIYVKAKPLAETVSFEGVSVHAGPPVAKVGIVTGVAVKPVKITPVLTARASAGRGPTVGVSVGVKGGPSGPGVGVGVGPGHAPGSGKPAGPKGGTRGGGHR